MKMIKMLKISAFYLDKQKSFVTTCPSMWRVNTMFEYGDKTWCKKDSIVTHRPKTSSFSTILLNHSRNVQVDKLIQHQPHNSLVTKFKINLWKSKRNVQTNKLIKKWRIIQHLKWKCRQLWFKMDILIYAVKLQKCKYFAPSLGTFLLLEVRFKSRNKCPGQQINSKVDING